VGFYFFFFVWPDGLDGQMDGCMFFLFVFFFFFFFFLVNVNVFCGSGSVHIAQSISVLHKIGEM